MFLLLLLLLFYFYYYYYFFFYFFIMHYSDFPQALRRPTMRRTCLFPLGDTYYKNICCHLVSLASVFGHAAPHDGLLRNYC